MALHLRREQNPARPRTGTPDTDHFLLTRTKTRTALVLAFRLTMKMRVLKLKENMLLNVLKDAIHEVELDYRGSLSL